MRKRFYALVASLAVVIGAVVLLNFMSANSQAALPRDCDNNSIINCGAITSGELTQKYNQNATGDLPAVYSHYGISSGMIAAGAPMGEVRKDGTVVLNGQVVATNAMSIGRHNMAGSSPISIGGKTYYNSPPSTSFVSQSIAAFIFLDGNGQFISAIITSCGNPVSATPIPKKPAPTFKCTGLTADKISRNEFNFTAKTEVTGGAAPAKYTFDFGDGKTAVTTAATAKHTYAAPGNYMAKVTVDFMVDGTTKTVTDQACQVNVPVEEMLAYKCDSLTVRTIKAEDRSYAFDLRFSSTGGAVAKSVDFDFGDGQTAEGLNPGAVTNVPHTYAKAGNYSIVATVHFDTSDGVKDAKCTATITTSPEMCILNPTLPKNDERCAPCPLPGKEQYPKDSPFCVTPPVQELPKTGPMDLAVGGVGIGSIVAAGYYWYTSRRGLIDALLNRL